MKVRDLSNFLSLEKDEASVGNLLISVSHWVKRVRKSKGGIEVSGPKEIETVRKLAVLKIVSLQEKGQGVWVQLTPEGKELYLDFFKHGYYGPEI